MRPQSVARFEDGRAEVEQLERELALSLFHDRDRRTLLARGLNLLGIAAPERM